MNKISFWLMSLFIGGFLVIAHNNAIAQEASGEAESTEVIVSKIQHNCSDLKANLRQIHTNDALIRVNSGQIYNSIATKLMARLNSRLSINRLDGAVLIDTTSKFEKLRTNFATQYNNYDNTMADLLHIDCKKSPAEFYNKLQETRKLRSELAVTANQLAEYIATYRQGVVDLSAQIKGGPGE